MCGLSRQSHGLWRLLDHTDRTLTWEADVAVGPLEPESDVGAAGEIFEGDVEGDADLDHCLLKRHDVIGDRPWTQSQTTASGHKIGI
jgi:hypothetical protein